MISLAKPGTGDPTARPARPVGMLRWPSLNSANVAKPKTNAEAKNATPIEQSHKPSPLDVLIELYPDTTQGAKNIDIVAIHSLDEDAKTAWQSLAPNAVPSRFSRSRATQSWLYKIAPIDEMDPADAKPKNPEAPASKDAGQNVAPEGPSTNESEFETALAFSSQDNSTTKTGPGDIPTIVEPTDGEVELPANKITTSTTNKAMLNPKFSAIGRVTSNGTSKSAVVTEMWHVNSETSQDGLSPQSVGVDWLKDPNMLPKIFPEARIMRVDSEIAVSDLSPKDSLRSLATNFINALKTKREDKTRPIIFICYGFGGIILEQVVISLEQDVKDEILANVVGVMFLATPFRDAMGLLKDAICGAAGSEEEEARLLSDLQLKFGKDKLSKLLDSFIKVAKRHNFEMSCFYQRDKVHSHSGKNRVDVNRENGSLESYPANACPADFRLMSKYTGPSDPTYRLVREELVGFQMNYAALVDKLSLLETLVTAGAPVDFQNRLKQTPLLLAARNGSLKTVTWLLENGADIAHKDINGQMTIHYAVLGSNKDLVKLLLRKGAVVDAKDTYGESAWDIARAWGTPEIKRLLKNRPLIRGPRLNPHTDSKQQLALSPHCDAAEESARVSEATIIDFFNVAGQELYFEAHPPLYNVIYGKGPKDILKQYRARTHKGLKPKFSWYHLPSNNPAWVEALFAKLGIPPSKAMWKQQLHRGSTPHSQFLKPIAREKDGVIAIFMPYLDFELHSKRSKMTQMINMANKNMLAPAEYLNYSENGSGPKFTEDGQSSSEGILGVIVEDGTRPAESTTREVSSLPSEASGTSKVSASRFGPSESQSNERDIGDFVARDFQLMHAYLRHEPALQIRRTLDQFYYFMLDDTSERDTGQVVYRWAKRKGEKDPMVIMVNQMWIWILGDGTVISSFPERWDRQDNYPDVLTGILEFLRLEERAVLANANDMAAVIMRYCLTVFERARFKDEFKSLQFMDMFESDIGDVADREPKCFQKFKTYSTALSHLENTMKLEPRNSLPIRRLKSMLNELESEDSLRYNTKPDGEEEEAIAQLKLRINMRQVLAGKEFKNYHEAEAIILDELINIDEETELLAEIKDVKDELNIMLTLLGEQKDVFKKLRDIVYIPISARITRILETKEDEIDKLTKHADKVYEALTALLDLRQRQTHVSEARSARKQAELSGRQQDTLMVFTIVTIIFLPLSFMASFFALNIKVFPQNSQGSNSFSLDYVAKYIFGISAALIVPLVITAFNVDAMTSAVRESWLVRKTSDFIVALSRMMTHLLARIKHWIREVHHRFRLRLQRYKFIWRDRARYLFRKKQLPQYEQDVEAEKSHYERGSEAKETEDTKAYLEEQRVLALRECRYVEGVHIDAKNRGLL